MTWPGRGEMAREGVVKIDKRSSVGCVEGAEGVVDEGI
jgi:hypothetical protein